MPSICGSLTRTLAPRSSMSTFHRLRRPNFRACSRAVLLELAIDFDHCRIATLIVRSRALEFLVRQLEA